MTRRLALVADDEPALRRYIRAVLEADGFYVVEAENVQQAWHLVETLGCALDVILTDIQMPGGDGLSFARAVKQTYPNLPVLLMSGQARPETILDFVQKPFPPAALLEAVHKLLPRTPAAAVAAAA